MIDKRTIEDIYYTILKQQGTFVLVNGRVMKCLPPEHKFRIYDWGAMRKYICKSRIVPSWLVENGAPSMFGYILDVLVESIVKDLRWLWRING